MTGAARVGMTGATPKVTVSPDEDMAQRLAERAKYEKMWAFDQYRAVAPGESIAAQFLAVAQPAPRSEVIDFGAGTGRGALMIALMGGCKVHMLDFAENCLDPEVHQSLTTQAHALTFKLHDLNRAVPVSAEYGYCTDVMEHIPPENVDRVLRNIIKAAQHVFFQIACEDDVCGALIGEPLHLSVHPYAWWLEKLQSLGCVVHWSQDHTSHCLFYVSGWSSGEDVVKIGRPNMDEDTIKAQVLTNIKSGWQQATPHITNDQEVILLGGGPSLVYGLEEIKQLRAAGAKLVCLNGAYNWALEHGLTPSAVIVVDAREFNARFTHPVVDECRYLIASQCHPAVFEGLPPERTFMWHTSAEMIRDILCDNLETWYGIPGGSTVMLRAIPLLRMLGFKRFHMFGFDSCLSDGAHHAYEQPENDSDIVIPTIVGGRTFHCHPWMVSQAQEFMHLIRFMGNEIELHVPGDGLIAHIINTGATLEN